MIFGPFLPLGNICKSIFFFFFAFTAVRRSNGSNLVIWDNNGAMRVESVRLGGVKLDELSLGIKQTVRNELSVKLGLKVVFS